VTSADDAIPQAPPRSLLVGAVATEDDAARVETVAAAAFPRSQLRRQYSSILLGSDTATGTDAALRLLAHNCAVHLVPGGTLAVSSSNEQLEAHLAACGFHEIGRAGSRTMWRRTERRTIHDLTADARQRLTRVTPTELFDRLGRGDAIVVDLRIPEDRRRHGVIEGSVAVPRTVLEWRADPTSGYTNEAFGSFDAGLVVVCNEGYSSSIAAATLVDLGYQRATDLIGGMLAWTDAGFAVTAPAPTDEGAFEGPVEDR
jgi:rhodanese-related sulfurtransferase